MRIVACSLWILLRDILFKCTSRTAVRRREYDADEERGVAGSYQLRAVAVECSVLDSDVLFGDKCTDSGERAKQEGKEDGGET